MHVAFVEDAEHDVDGDERRENQPRLACERRLECPRRPLEAPADRVRHADALELRFDRPGRLRQRDADRQVERDRGGDELRLMIDAERSAGGRISGEHRQRHFGAAACRDVDIIERVGRLPVLRRGFHDDVIQLIEGWRNAEQAERAYYRQD